MFALPGGFVGAEESPEQTAERKLREKTGVGSVHLEQLRTYADPADREIMCILLIEHKDAIEDIDEARACGRPFYRHEPLQ